MSSTEPSTDKPVTVAETDTKNTRDKQKTSGKKSSSAVTLMSGLFVLLAVSAAAYYYWMDLHNNLNKLGTTNTLQSASLTELSQQLSDSSLMIQQQQDKLTEITQLITQQQAEIKVLSDAQQTLLKTTQNIFDISHRSQSQWVLAEVSYLLSLANQRLLIARDIKTTVAALKSANQRLQDLSDPGLLKVRKQIASEIYQLNLLPLPDINSIAFSLDNMTQAITQLPFKSLQQTLIDNRQSSEDIDLSAFADDSFFAPLWARIKSLVTIKKHNRELYTAVTPVQKNDISGNLRSSIEASRLALINKNTAVFQFEINKAVAIISQHYEKTDSRVAALLEELLPLSQLTLLPELPDITTSWQLLHKIMAIKDANSYPGQSGLNINRGKSQQ
ncbi:MAG: uroporphyrinogen-III C-methyltransferase [Gammaproteobacteria bacterium]|nr:uroporphyrinogen-III C-methyltransferase [Gammaproteobacteria bacterium]